LSERFYRKTSAASFKRRDANLIRGKQMAKKLICAMALLIAISSSSRVFVSIPAYTPVQSPGLSFEAASIKPSIPGDRSGRYATMRGAHEFVVKNYTVKYLVSFAYNLPPRMISGGPSWMDSEMYDILAATPGEGRPTVEAQMQMTRNLLADRFKLTFHREQKEQSVYFLTAVRTGSKLKDSTAPPDSQPDLVNRVSPNQILLPARNATMTLFASMMQRSVLDRPVLDKTGLTGKYDFDLEWTPDDTQFGGVLPPVSPEKVEKPDLFAALQQQLGLRLESGRATVEVIVIDSVKRLSES
jgi:uncharacterized protein (TIGR03435 family)